MSTLFKLEDSRRLSDNHEGTGTEASLDDS